MSRSAVLRAHPWSLAFTPNFDGHETGLGRERKVYLVNLVPCSETPLHLSVCSGPSC